MTGKKKINRQGFSSSLSEKWLLLVEAEIGMRWRNCWVERMEHRDAFGTDFLWVWNPAARVYPPPMRPRTPRTTNIKSRPM